MVALADGDRRQAHFPRRGLDQPLHVIIAFGTARAAIGGNRNRIGQRALNADLNQRCFVDAQHVFDDVEGGHHRAKGRHIAAQIAKAIDPNGQKMPLGIQRQFGGDFRIAAMEIRQKAVRAAIRPFDRLAEHAGGMQQADIFRKDRNFHAERPADMARADMHFFGCYAQDGRQIGPHAENALTIGVQCIIPRARIIGGNSGTRLHGRHNNAVVTQSEACDMGCFLEGCRDFVAVAPMIINGDIVGDSVIKQRRAVFDRIAGVGHSGQGLDVELDRFGGINRRLARLGDHKGYGITDIADLVMGQCRTAIAEHGRAVPIGDGEGAADQAITHGLKVFGRIDGQNARHGLGCRGINAAQMAMGDRAADHNTVNLPRKIDVIRIASFPADEHGIFAPAHRLAYSEFFNSEGCVLDLLGHAIQS